MFFALSPSWHFAREPFHGFGVCVFVGLHSAHETKVQIVCCVTLTRFYSISFHAFCDCAEKPRAGERQNQNSVHRKYCSCLTLSAPLIEWTTNVWVGFYFTFFFGGYAPFPACKYSNAELYLRFACHIYPHGIWNIVRVSRVCVYVSLEPRAGTILLLIFKRSVSECTRVIFAQRSFLVYLSNTWMHYRAVQVQKMELRRYVLVHIK